jgi:hypothetical protein
MVTAKQAWIGFVTLLLVALLIIVAVMYWQHVTGTSYLHVMATIYQGGGAGQGC